MSRACGAAAGMVVAAAMVASASAAFADTPGAPVALVSERQLVSGGAGSQTDPHLSGDLVAYTASDSAYSEIRYADLATGTGGSIPTAGHRDSLPDVSGSVVVFRRIFVDGSTKGRPIMVFDTAAPEAGARELAPDAVALREAASIGGTTVAFQQQVGASSSTSDVCVADVTVPDVPATCLTTDGATTSNRTPDVSPDGSTVVFTKCLTTGLGCDVYVSRRGAGGTWAPPTPLTGPEGEDFQPVTDGVVVAYVSDAGGDWDIRWVNIDGTAANQLERPGTREMRPRISGGVISFESGLAGGSVDLYVYRPTIQDLYQLTDTADTDEILSDLSLAASGELRMVWAQADGATLGSNDIHALRAQLDPASGPAYDTCLRYDPAKAHRAGATVPLKLQLCDAAGTNLSSPGITLTATGLVRRDGTATTALVEDAGNANPDSAFRYDPDLAGYVYNLSTRGLATGTWELHFTVAGSPTIHRLPFDVR